MGTLLIDNYTSTTAVKTFVTEYGFYSTTDGGNQARFFGIFNSSSAITSIDIVRLGGTATFSNSSDTSIRLYGIS
jgi:hypothetical protein